MKDHVIAFTENPANIQFEANSATSPFLSLRELINEHRCKIFKAGEPQEEVPPAVFLSSWKSSSDTSIRWAISPAATGSGLTLDLLSIQVGFFSQFRCWKV